MPEAGTPIEITESASPPPLRAQGLREVIQTTKEIETNKPKISRIHAIAKALLQIQGKKLEQAEKQLSVDPLTGLMSKKLFEETIQRETELAKRDPSRKLGFAFLDIDDFGKFNKQYGQATGDKVLSEVGKTLQENIRKTDIAGREGGEEMGIIMPYTGTEERSPESNPSERVRQAIMGIDLKELRQITVSIGTTEFINNESYESFYNRADLAMRAAKQLGKNRTVVANPDPQKGIIFTDLTDNKKYTAEVTIEGAEKKLKMTEVIN